MNSELLVSKQNNRRRKRGFFRKTFLFFLVFLLTFYISNVEIPQLPFLKGIYPKFVVLNIENSLLTILFLSILLMTIGKKYTYLFNVEPLKKEKTYIWIFATIVMIYVMMVLFTDVSGLIFYSSPLEFSYFILLLIRVVIIVPIEEEFVYRGLLLLIPSNKIKYLMLIVSSIIFALVHDDPYKLIWLSLGLGILGIRFNNIWIPIIAHSIWNLLASFFAVKV